MTNPAALCPSCGQANFCALEGGPCWCGATMSSATSEACLCASCLAGNAIQVFDADGARSREFLSRRGSCCESGCRNCPYEPV
ncbi:MAG: hypothetical protein JNK63_07780 [Chthonomonas sp.]|nr:hypothetical protein [Chthonomonas sp.]